jgi:signal transduction histidine kinase
MSVAAPTAEPSGGHELELAWLVLAVACLAAIVVLPAWRVVPFSLIWLSLALLAWQVHRRLVARERAVIAAEADRILAVQRRFLQDASHQLRTPITIALGHAELLAGALAQRREQRDIHVVVGELGRLKALSERLLLVAASQNPDFLVPERVDLDRLAVDVVRRWRPTAPRRWQLGQLDHVSALADAGRLSLALDALIENAVRHTKPDQEIKVSVRCDQRARTARIVVEDAGTGIAECDLPHIFDRFRTATAGEQRGTGLGLSLVRSIAHGHGGEVYVQSVLGEGSRFELLIPAMIDQIDIRPTLGQEAW